MNPRRHHFGGAIHPSAAFGALNNLLPAKFFSHRPDNTPFLPTNRSVTHLDKLVRGILIVLVSFVLESRAADCVPPPAGLVAWWPGDGAVFDVVGTNHGTLQNGATYAAGMVGQAFIFDGIDDFFEVAHSPILSFVPGSTGTIEFWFYRTKAASVEHFLGKRTDCSGSEGFNYQCAYDGSFPPPPPLNQWIHFAQVYATNGIFVYTNGVLWSSFAGTFSPVNTASLRIGTSDSCPSSQTFGGLIDEVCIFNRALTTNEIAAIFVAGNTGKCRSNEPPQTILVTTTLPAAGTTNALALDRFSITTSRALLTNSANSAANFTLREAGGNGSLGDGDDVMVGLTPNYASGFTVNFSVATVPLQPGRYRLQTSTNLLDLNTNAVAPYTNDFVIAHPALGRIENLSNGTLPEATDLPLTESPSGSGFLTTFAAGTFFVVADVDYWRIQAQAGDQITVRLEANTTGVFPRLRLRNGADTDLPTVNGDNAEFAEFQNYQIPTDGYYYLRVWSDSKSAAYGMRVDVGRNAQLESESNDGQSTATALTLTPTTGGSARRVAGALVVSDSSGDYFRSHALNVGNTISVDLLLPEGSSLTTNDLLTVERQGSSLSVAANSTGQLTYTLTNDGLHYVRIQSSQHRALRGQYVLNVFVADAVPPVITELRLANGYGSQDQVVTNGSVLSLMADRFRLSFSEDLLPATVNQTTNYDLRSAGSNGTWGDGDDETYPVLSPSYSTGPAVTCVLASGPMQPGIYRLTVTGLQDRAGNVLAAPFVREFTVTGVNGFGQESRTNGSAPSATSLSLSPGNGPNGTFTVWGNTPGGANNPYFVAAGHFNSDSNLDLVTANWGNSSVSVFLGNGAEGFALTTNLNVGGNPTEVAVGDLNGDGFSDVAVANYNGNTVNVLLGNGAGGLALRTNHTGFNRPYSVVLGDFNGDSRPDLAVANNNGGNVSVLLGDGTGAFPVRTNYTVGANPWGLAVGDVTGEGHLDLIVANSGTTNISVLPGNGDGTFGAPTNYPVGGSPRRVAIADLNGDSVADLVVLKGDNTLGVLLGTGGGSFAAPTNFPTGGSDPYHFVLADLNGDSRLDAIVANYGSRTVSVLLGNGDGTFQPTLNYGNVGNVRAVAVGDWNRDDRPDIAAAYWDADYVVLLFGNRADLLAEDPVGSGLRSGFGRGNLRDNGDHDYWSFTAQAGDLLTVALETPGSPGNNGMFYWVRDPDGDSLGETTTTDNGWGQYGPLTLTQSGTYTVRVRHWYGILNEYRLRVSLARPPLQMESEDNNQISQANRPEFVLTNGQETARVAGYISVGDGNGDYFWLRNRAAGTRINLELSRPASSGLVPQLQIYNAANTSMTNSPAGASNLVFDVVAGSDYYARMAGSGSGLLAQYILSITVTDAVPPVITELRLANGYGSQDQVVTNGSVLSLMADRFRLSFSEDLLPATVNQTTNYDLRSAGSNGTWGDGDDETYPVLSPSYSTGPAVTCVLASGPMQPGIYRLTVTGLQDRAGNVLAAPFVREFTVTGVNGFGQESRTNGSAPSATSLSLSPGNGPNGTFTVWGNTPGGANNPYFVAAGHFNSDSNLDLVTANWGNSSVSVFLGNGAEGFALTTNLNVGGNPTEVAVGDLNGDGFSDVAVANYNGNTVNVLLGNGAGGLALRTNHTGFNRPYSVVLGDFNGDSRPDLAVANNNGGNVSVLLGDGTGAFPVRTNYTVGANPWGLAVGDVTGEGHLDLIVANSGTTNISVLPGNGDGTFGAPTNYPVGGSPRRVAIADLNGDSVADLVVLKGDNTLGVLLGTGGGSFAAPTNFPTGGSDPYHFVLADLNGDSRLDAIVANYGSRTVSVLLGNGDGTFQPTLNYGNVGNVRAVAVGDWNRDDRPDIAAAYWDADYVVLLFGNRADLLAEDPVGSGLRSGFGRGNLRDNGDHDYWSFTAQAGDLLTVALETPGSPGNNGMFYWVRDPDGDSLGETTTTDNGWGQYGPLTLTQSGTYTVRVRHWYGILNEYRLRVSLARPPLQMESEDNNQISQANRPEFVLTNGQETARVAGYISVGDGNGDYFWLRNRAAGTRINLELSRPASSGLVPQLQIYNAANTSMTNSPAGASNLVFDVVAGSDYYARMAGSGSGLLAQYILSITVTDAVPPVITELRLANGYGSQDQVVTNGSVLSLMADRFRLSFSEDLLPATVNQTTNYDLRSAGSNGTWGDGDDETYPVLSPSYSTGPAVTCVLASGPMQPGIYRLTVTGLQDRAGNVLAAPFVREFTVTGVNGFGQESRTNGSAPSATSLSLSPGNGPNGTFTVWGNTPGGANNPYFVAAGHFNSDSNLDLVTANWGNSSVSVFLGNGAEGFALTTNLNVGGNPTEVAVGDLNGDGFSDVAVANYNGNTVNVLLGNGAGGLALRTNHTGFNRPYSVVLGDFNGDSRPDLAVANNNGGNVSVLLGDGTGAFPVRTNYTVGANPWGLAVGDVTGEGHLDLIVANSGTTNISVLPGNGDGTFGAPTNYPVGGSPRRVAIADLNGDSVADLVVLKGDNTLGVLLGTGGGSFAAPTNFPTGGSDPYHFVLADLNGDSRLDAIVANYGSRTVSVLLGNGDGTFQPTLNYGNVGNVRAVAVGDWNRDDRPDIAAAYWDADYVVLLFGNRADLLAEDPVGSGLRSGFGRGNLRDNGDHDYWSFTAQAGDLLTVALETPGSPGNNGMFYWVRDPDGDSLGETTTTDNGWGQYGPLTLTQSGTYTVRVRHWYGILNEYRLRVSLARPPLQMESEDNNQISQANRPEFVLTNGQETARVAGYISVGDGNGDYFWLRNRAAGTRINLELSRPASSGLVPQLQIYNAANTSMTNSPAGASNLVFDVVAGPIITREWPAVDLACSRNTS